MKAWITKGASFSLLVIGFSLCIVPVRAAAGGLKITEIMYDLPGSDSGREWVEITNTGSDKLDIEGYRLSEGGTNHVLSVVSGTTTLVAGQSVIVVSNASKFSADWPQYAGILLKSSFSLSNTAETIEIKDATLYTLDSVSYTADGGAAGDGNTLHRVGATLVAGAPDPGVYTVAAPVQSAATPTPPPAAAPEPVVSPTPAATSASSAKTTGTPEQPQVQATHTVSSQTPAPQVVPQASVVSAPVATHAESVAVAPKAPGSQSSGSKKSRYTAHAASLSGNGNSSGMSASVAEASGAPGDPMLLYGLALGALVLLGAATALFMRPQGTAATSSRAKEFELE